MQPMTAMQEPSTASKKENDEILRMLLNLNDSIKNMGSRFDTYQR